MSNTNAQTELLYILGKWNVEILCADLTFGNDISSQDNVSLITPYTKEEYDSFMKGIDRNYNSGYGGQELFGTVWFTDETWLERGEYDGSEWWEFKKTPKIPNYLRNTQRERENTINDIMKNDD